MGNSEFLYFEIASSAVFAPCLWHRLISWKCVQLNCLYRYQIYYVHVDFFCQDILLISVNCLDSPPPIHVHPSLEHVQRYRLRDQLFAAQSQRFQGGAVEGRRHGDPCWAKLEYGRYWRSRSGDRRQRAKQSPQAGAAGIPSSFPPPLRVVRDGRRHGNCLWMIRQTLENALCKTGQG